MRAVGSRSYLRGEHLVESQGFALGREGGDAGRAERDDADDTADARDRGDDARARRGRLLLGSIEGSGGGPVPRLRGGGDQRRARVHRDVLRTRVGLKSDSYAERSRA